MSLVINEWWPLLLAALAIVSACHAVLNKREVRAAAGWVGLILLVPGVGALLYWLLGVNRIRRTAERVRAGMRRYEHLHAKQIPCEDLEALLPVEDRHLAGIARTVGRTSRWSLLSGNHVTPLRNGDEAYPAMLDCIRDAQHSIALCTYIFDNDTTGLRFVDALVAAKQRGVEVRVLIDDAGARYSWPPIDRALRKRGVTTARFMPVWTPWSAAFANLRNHRKVMVVDGVIGFSGGMNIRHCCVLAENPSAQTPSTQTRDVHFRFDGPVVTELMDVFAEDWTFTTREVLDGDRWFPVTTERGDTIARTISDGPDRDLDCIPWALHGAIGSAQQSIRIVTPYFLPDEPLITALNAAALRGVQVDIVLPERGNLRVVHWAMRGELWKVLQHGCRVWVTPAPFDHAKVMTVDNAWSLVGSSNWDPRSLRLNFELAVECYDRTLAAQLNALVDDRITTAKRFDTTAFAATPFPLRLRDAAARLLSPYL